MGSAPPGTEGVLGVVPVGSEPPVPDFYSVFFCSSGIRSWDIDLTCCNLDEQLKLFVSRHSATFSSIVKGEK